MLKIWGRKNSINVQKVMWTVGELGLKPERIDAGMAHGIVGEPWYATVNPNRLVPAIDDDGAVLWESNVIVRYLAAKHAPGTLMPTDPVLRAKAEMWMDWQQTSLPGFGPLFLGLIRTPPEKRDPNAIAAGKEKSVAAAKIMDAQLGKTQFLAGDAFSYGDIPVGIMMYRYMQLIPERAATPNLDRWYAAISSRPAFKEQIAVVPLT